MDEPERAEEGGERVDEMRPRYEERRHVEGRPHRVRERLDRREPHVPHDLARRVPVEVPATELEEDQMLHEEDEDDRPRGEHRVRRPRRLPGMGDDRVARRPPRPPVAELQDERKRHMDEQDRGEPRLDEPDERLEAGEELAVSVVGRLRRRRIGVQKRKVARHVPREERHEQRPRHAENLFPPNGRREIGSHPPHRPRPTARISAHRHAFLL